MRRTIPGRMRVIAITGTSGKTTTAWLTAAVLAEAGMRVGVLSDLGCLGPDDHAAIASDYRSAGSLARWLDRLAVAGCSHAIVEVSGRMLAHQALADVACDTLVVTNMAGGGRGPRRARLAAASQAVTTLEPGGCLVSGCDREAEAFFRPLLPVGGTMLAAGLHERCAVTATAVEGSLFGRTVLASWGGCLVPLSVGPPVVPYIRDCLLAAAVGGHYGVALESCVRGIEAAGSVPGRMERLDRGQDAAVFIDSPTSRHALAATLKSLRRLTRGRLAVIAEEPLVARLGRVGFGPLVSRYCDTCVVAPATVLADEPTETDVAAYARIDRTLESLGTGDCCLLLGGIGPDGRPARSAAGRFPLVALADAWLQLAFDPADPSRRRAA
jgi:UDP-N-acetylmuramoyl-L-alanyl-D-glutamate--2,6-diaminopimelate ligase